MLSILDRKAAFGCDDAPAVIATPATTALGVYDGRGTHNDGDGATMSQLAAQKVHESLAATELKSGTLGTALATALSTANDALARKGSEEKRYLGCGSLATVAGFDRTSLFVAHVGDGCALLLRKTGWCLLSRSQTLSRLARDSGIDGENNFPAHVLATSLGSTPRVTPLVSVVPLRRDDRLLLCTGSLRQALGLKLLVSTLRRGQPPAEICEALLQAASEGPDPQNMTAAVVDFLWNDWPEPSAADPPPLLVETSTAWFQQEDPS